MKNIYKILKACCFALLIVFMVLSCDDKHDFNKYDQPIDANAAKLKFVHTAVGPNGVNFSVNFSVDNKKISAINVLSGLPLGVSVGATYPSPLNYALVSSGSQIMNIVIPARAAVASPVTAAFPETPVLSTPLVTETGKDYSSFLAGFSPNFTLHTIRDDFSMVNPSSRQAFVRYINLTTNTPAAGYEVVISRTTPAPTVVLQTFSGVQYLGGSPAFVPIPTILDTESVPYTVQLRVTGTTTVVSSIANFVPRPGRVYTLFSRGRVGGVPTATVNAPLLTFYTNR